MRDAKFIIVLTLFTLASCGAIKLVFQDQRLSDFEKLDIKTVIKLEEKRHAKDITPDYLIGIGEGIYPNKNEYILATPKTFEIKESSKLKFQTEYFYSSSDSLVKAILYQWNYMGKNNAYLFEEQNYSRKFKLFQEKFDNLASLLMRGFGVPVTNNIEQNLSKDDTFRDDYKFTRADGLNAYLFMFGNNSSGYREIRLAIYKD